MAGSKWDEVEKNLKKKMAYGVILLSRTEVELEDAFLWYEYKSKGLDKRFLNSFRSEVKRIGNNPFSAYEEPGYFIEVAVNSFPYVYYIVCLMIKCVFMPFSTLPENQ